MSIKTKPEASLLVSLADKTHNARTIVSDLDGVDEDLWDRFSQDRSGVLWYHRSLADVFEARMPGALARELSRNVRAMHAFIEDRT